MKKTVYVVIEDNAEEGIESFVYESEEDARKMFNDIVNEYKSKVEELGNGEINNYWAEITDKWDYEVARVFWQETFLE